MAEIIENEVYKCTRCLDEKLVRTIGHFVCPSCDITYWPESDGSWLADREPKIEDQGE